MELIQNNPYRIAGILSNATERELQKQKTKIKAYTKVGKEIKSDFDFQILGNIDRTEDSVNKAFSNVEQNQDKVNYALFWFLNASPFDNTAIEYLKNGDEEKALEIWEKVTTDKDINSKNFSAFNNLGTYKLLSRDKSDIKRGIEAKIKLIESDYFESFVHSVADETYTIDNQKQSEKLIDGLLTQFKNQFSSSETLQLFSGCNGTTQKYLSKKFTEEPLHKIESQIESCKKKRKADKGNAYEFGLRLFKNTKDDLSLLKSLLGTSDLKYKAVADQLANEIMQCGIDYFNESHENDSSVDFLKQAQELNNTALSIAVGKLTRDRAKDSLATLEEMKDREVDQAIALLQSVKDAFETNEANIRRQIEELKQNDIELKFGLKTINYSAVEDNIKNSIDWSKVNDLLREVLSDKNLIKIKESSKTDAKNEFWDLVNWLEDNSLKSSTISTVINKYKKIPPKIFFDIISADITNTDSKSNSITEPFYVENIRYVGLKLNITSNGSQEVTIFKKYVNPDGKYKHSSNSPEGYTTSTSETITPQTKIIDLGGYGNGKECTYQVGNIKLKFM
jgi:tetratricopeptide (TPR) repeat protein